MRFCASDHLSWSATSVFQKKEASQQELQTPPILSEWKGYPGRDRETWTS